MRDALQAISEEHRGMWRMTTALEELRRNLDVSTAQPDVELFGLIVDYIERYNDKVHQPKEEAFLYEAVRRRTHEADALIAELEQEHVAGPEIVRDLREKMLRLAEQDRVGVAAFQEALDRYVQMIRAHIMREESQLFPVARKILSAADWVEIDAAFADEQTLTGSEQVRAEFRALMSRLRY